MWTTQATVLIVLVTFTIINLSASETRITQHLIKSSANEKPEVGRYPPRIPGQGGRGGQRDFHDSGSEKLYRFVRSPQGNKPPTLMMGPQGRPSGPPPCGHPGPHGPPSSSPSEDKGETDTTATA